MYSVQWAVSSEHGTMSSDYYIYYIPVIRNIFSLNQILKKGFYLNMSRVLCGEQCDTYFFRTLSNQPWARILKQQQQVSGNLSFHICKKWSKAFSINYFMMVIFSVFPLLKALLVCTHYSYTIFARQRFSTMMRAAESLNLC